MDAAWERTNCTVRKKPCRSCCGQALRSARCSKPAKSLTRSFRCACQKPERPCSTIFFILPAMCTGTRAPQEDRLLSQAASILTNGLLLLLMTFACDTHLRIIRPEKNQKESSA